MDSVAEKVADVEDEPDTDCETELVPQDEALREPDTVPHALVVDDGDGVVEVDVQIDALLELVTDGVIDVENVDDTVDDAESELSAV